MKLVNQTINSLVTLTYKDDMAIVEVDGKYLTSFEACILFDFLRAHMSPSSHKSGISRRAKQLSA